MKVKPLDDLLLIELVPNESRTASGVIIKEAWETAQNRAVIVDVGSLVTDLKIKETVIINPYALIDVTSSQPSLRSAPDKKYLIRRKDVLATYAQESGSPEKKA